MTADPVRRRSLRSRLTAGLSLGLLLLMLASGPASGAVPTSSSAAGGTVSGVRAPVAVAPHALPSCQGTEACFNVTGTVGENACNGFAACYHDNPWAGSVGANSCDGIGACENTVGSVGTGSCKRPSACYYAVGPVGDRSCNGSSACVDVTTTVGRFACNGELACYLAADTGADCAGNVPGFVPAPCFTTRTVMGSSADPAAHGEAVRLWATVFARYPMIGKPGGMFQFRMDGRTLPNPVAIDRHGRAVITRTLQPGIHWVSGRYLGDGTFGESVPVPLPEIVVVP
jgi:hypothetical protein